MLVAKAIVVKVNLTDCKFGIFQMINASERLSIQRLGRTMRHKYPVVIFPYWKNSREDEIVKKICEQLPYTKTATVETLRLCI